MLGEGHAGQQAAVRAALDPEPPRAGDLAGDEVAANRGEIVIDDLALGLEARLMPRRAEFAPAADVGEDIDAAALKP